MALIEWSYYSNVLRMMNHVNIVVPRSLAIWNENETDMIEGKELPVLYLLHGMSDDHTTWLRRTAIERYADAKDIIVVIPSTALGWYTDTQYGLNYFHYIADELPAVCQKLFHFISKKRELNFVAGNSMGGYGAFKLALSRPERFAAACSFSGVLNLDKRLSSAIDNTSNTFWEGIFGDLNKLKNSPNDLFFLASEQAGNATQPSLYFCCGTEDFLYENNQKMKTHLDDISYPYHYHEGPGGHSWEYWDTEVELFMNWILDYCKTK